MHRAKDYKSQCTSGTEAKRRREKVFINLRKEYKDLLFSKRRKTIKSHPYLDDKMIMDLSNEFIHKEDIESDVERLFESGKFQKIVDALDSKNDDVKRGALSIIMNITSLDGFYVCKIIECDVIKRLMHHLEYKNVKIVSDTINVLCNIIVDSIKENRIKVFKEGFLDKLLQCARWHLDEKTCSESLTKALSYAMCNLCSEKLSLSIDVLIKLLPFLTRFLYSKNNDVIKNVLSAFYLLLEVHPNIVKYTSTDLYSQFIEISSSNENLNIIGYCIQVLALIIAHGQWSQVEIILNHPLFNAQMQKFIKLDDTRINKYTCNLLGNIILHANVGTRYIVKYGFLEQLIAKSNYCITKYEVASEAMNAILSIFMDNELEHIVLLISKNCLYPMCKFIELTSCATDLLYRILQVIKLLLSIDVDVLKTKILTQLEHGQINESIEKLYNHDNQDIVSLAVFIGNKLV